MPVAFALKLRASAAAISIPRLKYELSTPVENSPLYRSKIPPPSGGDSLQFQPSD